VDSRQQQVSAGRIVRLTAENFKRLVAVEIVPEGDVVKIVGRNAQGKSSVLDAIEAAIGGGKAQPVDPIRHGAAKARVVLECEDLVVERKWDSRGSRLEVRAKNGGKLSSPQTVLDSLYDRIALDPLAFMRLGPKGQRDALAAIAGISDDLARLESQRQSAYEKRRDIGRDIKRIEGALAQVGAVDADDCEPVDIAAATEEYQAAIDALASARRQRAKIESLEETCSDLRAQLARAEKDLADAKAAYGDIDEADLENRLCSLKQRLDSAAEANERAAAARECMRLEAELNTLREERDRCSSEIDTIERQKADLVANAHLPVEGLSFDDERVLYNGVPLEQASAAEQAIVSTSIAMARDLGFKAVLLRDASVLDSQSLKAVCELAVKNGRQVIIEQVSEGQCTGIVIEDGRVVQPTTEDGKCALS